MRQRKTRHGGGFFGEASRLKPLLQVSREAYLILPSL